MKNKKYITGVVVTTDNETRTLFSSLSDMNFLCMWKVYMKFNELNQNWLSMGFYFVYLHDIKKYHITIDPSIYLSAETIMHKSLLIKKIN